MTKQCPNPHVLSLYLDNKLSREERKPVIEHLLECTECSGIVEDVLLSRALDEIAAKAKHATATTASHATAPDTDPVTSKKMLQAVQACAAKYGMGPKKRPQPKAPSKAKQLGAIVATVGAAIGDAALSVSRLASAPMGFGFGTPALGLGTPAVGLGQKDDMYGDFGSDDAPQVAPSAATKNDVNDQAGASDLTDNTTQVGGSNTMNNTISYGDFDSSAPQVADPVIGTPASDTFSQDVLQSHPSDCAVRSQELILKDFGYNISEDDLCNEAAQQGWYSESGGTPLQDVGNLLESHGVDVHRFVDANAYTLTNELAQGHKVIVAVDSGELWKPGLAEKTQDLLGFEHPDHALLVSGIDTTDPNNIQVVVTDPGTGEVAKSYPLDQFTDAWQDSKCYMVSTQSPPPVEAFGMANFDYINGCVPDSANFCYDNFLDTYSYQFDPPLSDQQFDEAIAHWEMSLGDSAADDGSNTPDDNDYNTPDTDYEGGDDSLPYGNDDCSSPEDVDDSMSPDPCSDDDMEHERSSDDMDPGGGNTDDDNSLSGFDGDYDF